MYRIALMALTVLAFASSTACRAQTAAESGTVSGTVPPDPARPDAAVPGARVKPQAPSAGSPPAAGVRRPPGHRTVAQGIDENVRRLTRGLDLTAEQQSKLREILWDRHRQITNLRSERLDAGADRVGLNVAIQDRTKARIRAILNEDQKKKYSTDVPRDMTAPAQADLKHWMDVQESKRRNGEDDSN